MRVNGTLHTVEDAWLGETLLYVLRERLGLPGSKNACEQGECGSCSLLLDEVVVCACLVLAVDAVGSSIETVEGLSASGEVADIQAALVERGGVQCGFCTPGFVVAIHELLRRSPGADDLEVREALSGNLCRCTGYGRILDAVRAVQHSRGATLTGEGTP
ncbi:MAG: (2Fe-2S)-binding protein [Acidimicrobiales bacterium]